MINWASKKELIHYLKYIGYCIDHEGISFDGGVEGWSDVLETFNVTLELVKPGYSNSDIEQMWSGNLFRVLDDVQAVAKGFKQ